jgi:hypothetical protein
MFILFIDSVSEMYGRKVYLKHDVSETGFWHRLQVDPTRFGPTDRADPRTVPGSIDWAQMRSFHLKTETESSLRNGLF